tara:strand:+ start:249 stop:1859 length:1611 start_codon:yes stop_codon:yes gene_type:complete
MIIWAISVLCGLTLPIIFYRHISNISEEKQKNLISKLIFFNLIEYIFIQSSLIPIFISGQMICYTVDISKWGGDSIESAYSAWFGLAILIALSIFFNKKIKNKKKIKNFKTIYFIAGLLILFHTCRVYHRYITSPYNSQRLGNYFESKNTTESKLLIGKENCDCSLIDITLNENTENKHDSIINSMLNNELTIRKYLNYLEGTQSLISVVALPSMQDYERSLIEIDSNLIISKIKLTGGQSDHFNTEKRSLRIKLKDTLLGMRKFNIYNPLCRIGGLYEWINIELMKSEGLIGLNTGYLDVTINDKNRGIYFYQEQPTVQTLLNNNKSPGLILRINLYEEGGVKRIKIINYYDVKSLPSKDFYKEQNQVLINIVRDYNNAKIGIDQLVSIPKIAKYLALIDLCNGYHGAELRNIYFYLNPKDSLLEPIGREFATNYFKSSGSNYLYPFELAHFDEEIASYAKKPFNLKSNDFEKHYIEFLKKISSEKYFNNFFKNIKIELVDRQYCLYKAEPSIKSFSKNHYYNNQVLIRHFLKSK